MPRGIRNNNLGNIKPGDPWQGAVGDDGTFLIFADMSWGVRAIAQSLINMINKKHLDTIATLIPAWSATDQAAYVANVAAFTTIDPNAQLGTDPDTIGSIVQAIINQENGAGAQFVTPDDISEGMAKVQSGLLTSLTTAAQAAVIEVQTNPIPYAIGAGVLVLILVLLGRKK